jgi:hypothetical protein
MVAPEVVSASETMTAPFCAGEVLMVGVATTLGVGLLGGSTGLVPEPPDAPPQPASVGKQVRKTKAK